jgi:hypothetical protein
MTRRSVRGRRQWLRASTVRRWQVASGGVAAGSYRRDGLICWICAPPMDADEPLNGEWRSSIDHVQPRYLGGWHELANLRSQPKRLICRAKAKATTGIEPV